MEFKRHVESEPLYLTAMRECMSSGLRVYPVPKSNYWYWIEIDDNGWIWRSAEEYKSTPRYKKDKHWDKEVFKIYHLIVTLNNKPKMKNILEEASEIIFNRDSEKAKQYGPFHDSMKNAAKIMTILTGKHITTRDFYKAMMSLKLARMEHSDKHDTYLDLIAYIASASTLKDKPLIEKDFE